MTTTLEELQDKAVAFRDERDWRQFHQPKDLALALQVEAAELAELFLWKTLEECDEALEEEEFRARLGEEIADVQIYLLYLAEVAGMSVAEVVQRKLELNGRKYPVEKAKGSAKKYTEFTTTSREAAPNRVIAVDWSGDQSSGHRKIWLCEVVDGQVVRLENGRSREVIAEHLVEEAQRDPGFVVGLDFAFSFPAWFLDRRGCQSPEGAWEEAARRGEGWLARSPFPFWGKPGKKKPRKDVPFSRRAEIAVAEESGFTPLSIFQTGGAGAVGVGSIRGMPMLRTLRDAGFSIWPFDAPRSSDAWPLVVEIWPRLFMDRVKKSRPKERTKFLRKRYPGLSASVHDKCAASDDAFDALVSGLEMDRHREEFGRLERAKDPITLLEGDVWRPGVGVSSRRDYPCPIPGCAKVFRGGRGGWDRHVLSMRMHPDWHPAVGDSEERKRLFREEYGEWFR